MRITLALAGSSLIALCTPAFAQTDPHGSATVPNEANTTVNTPNSATSGAAPQDQAQAADIIVTANKREERLQNVPIAVTVVGGNQLTQQNVVSTVDLVRSAPSLNVAGVQGALSIRGVGAQSFSRTSESSVGVVVDGVALGNASQFPPPLFDASRVEVLNGPQGTLFGRNASAGVLNVVTNAPDPSRYEVVAHADVGSRNSYLARAVVNVPVADNAALRVSGIFDQAPETVYNRFDRTQIRNQTRGGRARFKWDPTDRVSVNLIADYGVNTQKGGSPWAVSASSPGSVLTSRLTACGVKVRRENQEGCTDGGNDVKIEAYGFSGQFDLDLGGVTLTSISAYRASISRQRRLDSDSVPVNRLNVNGGPQDVRNFSQELRLTSPAGGLVEYTAGLYYFDSALDGSNTQVGQLLADYPVIGICPIFPGAPLALCGATLGSTRQQHVDTVSYAAYGQATIHATSALRLIVGARVGHEDVRDFSPASVAPGALAAFSSTLTIRAHPTDSYFSYRGGVQYDLARGVMGYATYTRGYKGPAVNDVSPTAGGSVVVQPEIPHNTEVGVKATLLNGRLGVNVAGFRNVVTNFQTQFFDPFLTAYVYGNAPKLVAQGVSLDIFGAPVRGLTLNGGFLYNDAKYGAGYNVACFQGETAAQGCTAGATSAAGHQLVGAPKWKVTGNAQYATSLGGSLEGFVGGDVVYTSRINYLASTDPGTSVAPAAIFSARAGLRTHDQRYGISVFGRNLFDVYRPVLIFETPLAAQQLDFRSYASFPGRDSRRVLGVTLDARF